MKYVIFIQMTYTVQTSASYIATDPDSPMSSVIFTTQKSYFLLEFSSFSKSCIILTKCDLSSWLLCNRSDSISSSIRPHSPTAPPGDELVDGYDIITYIDDSVPLLVSPAGRGTLTTNLALAIGVICGTLLLVIVTFCALYHWKGDCCQGNMTWGE